MRIRSILAISVPSGCGLRLRRPTLPGGFALFVQAPDMRRAVLDKAQRIAASDLNVCSAAVLRPDRKQGDFPAAASAGYRPSAVGQVRVPGNRDASIDLAIPIDAVVISNSLDRGPGSRVPPRWGRTVCSPEVRCPSLRVSPHA